ncbi:sugar transferase [Streptomyces sp. NPDC097619]|uniref:sugar transferase n=1 Tax=Streptomyces sp. NPDC097619 TaxID=3157228 RepID=UPI003319D1D9
MPATPSPSRPRRAPRHPRPAGRILAGGRPGPAAATLAALRGARDTLTARTGRPSAPRPPRPDRPPRSTRSLSPARALRAVAARLGRLPRPGAKRVFDLGAAALLLAAALPALLLLAAALAVSCRAAPLVRAPATGLGGRPYRRWLLRTAGSPLGDRLRRHRLQGIPQLWNVLRGEMSLVGPRPELRPGPRGRLWVRPGMTGLWQVSARSELPWEEMTLLDLHYVEHHWLGMDLAILAQTPRAAFRAAPAPDPLVTEEPPPVPAPAPADRVTLPAAPAAPTAPTPTPHAPTAVDAAQAPPAPSVTLDPPGTSGAAAREGDGGGAGNRGVTRARPGPA